MRHTNRNLSLIGLFTVLIIVTAPFLGLSDHLTPEIERQILFDIRLPRLLLAFIVGAGLSICGLVFQAMFHNPLATPFTLGVASGASLGAALSVFLGVGFSLFGFSSTALFAFIGALVTIRFVYGISTLNKGFSLHTLLLTGVAISFFFSSLILLIQYLNDMPDAYRLIRWLMGNLAVVGYESIWPLLPFVLLTITVVFYLSHELNLLTTGDDIALSRGVNVTKTRLILFFMTSLCIGAIVALCGPIGFVGMMVPHICRLLIGQNHRWLVPASCLFGGGFLIVCDTVARLIIAPAEIPVGVITTLLGGPFFLWLLIRTKTPIS
jgi:iron complex transport system permease protein